MATMNQADLDVFRKNIRLKKTFRRLNLDLIPIMEFMPYHLAIENRRLANLLAFVEKYQECQSRDVMELMGKPFPPIFPTISPESDWYRFRLWLKGEPVKKTLRAQLPKDFQVIPPDQLTEITAKEALNNLGEALNLIGYGFDLRNGIPAKVMYQYLWITLAEEFDLDGEGGWVLDGCDGYCPGCFQRPWCDTGQESHWTEDEKAGKMALPEILTLYVSPSPVSLELLREHKEEETMYDLSDRDQDSGYVPDPLNRGLYERQSYNWEDEVDMPF